MGRIILVYGVIAGITVALLMQLSIKLVPEGGTTGMVVGFASMIVGLSFVFIGVKRYRDVDLGGVIGFWKALLVGFGIAAIATCFYVAGWELYLFLTDYTYMDEFARKAITKAQAAGTSAEKMAELNAQLDMFKGWYANPLTRIAATASEISFIAIPIPIMSAGLLCYSSILPARQPHAETASA